MSHLANGYTKLLWKNSLIFLATFLSLSIVSVSSTGASELEESVEQIKKHISAGMSIRLRNEAWNTFEKQGTSTDNTFDFFLIRARGFMDVSLNNFTFHIMAQGVKALNLPTNVAFGAGPLYFSASGRDQNPGNLQLAELSLQIKDLPIPGFYLKGGRIGIKEGTEVLYWEPKFDWVKKERLGERLVGNWDWVNIGRRYDGGTAGYTNNAFNLNFFGANVLQGGFDFDDGYEELDHVVVAGGAFTLKKDVVVPNTEFRIFDIFYFDNRTPAIETTGDELKINTLGVSIVGVYDIGVGQMDVLIWSALQTGNFGNLDQRAFAFIGEIGYQLLQIRWKPWLRLGVVYASGDGDPSDSNNGTFFNLVPTNHKFYGHLDSFALSNLENYYAQLVLQPHKKVDFIVDGHFFKLASDNEFWITGSGPFNNQAFGYVFIKPAPGNEIKRNIGEEIDLSVNVAALDFLSFQVGYSHFFGGSGAGAVFDKKDDFDWFYAQSVISF